MILLGGFVMAIAYEMVSDCLNRFSNSPCWDPRLYGGSALGFYIGTAITILGAIVLVGPNILRRFRKPQAESNPER